MNAKQCAWAYLVAHGHKNRHAGRYDTQDTPKRDLSQIDWEKTLLPYEEQVSEFVATDEPNEWKTYLVGELHFKSGPSQWWWSYLPNLGWVYSLVDNREVHEKRIKDLFGDCK
jgi:hypothetical protein